MKTKIRRQKNFAQHEAKFQEIIQKEDWHFKALEKIEIEDCNLPNDEIKSSNHRTLKIQIPYTTTAKLLDSNEAQQNPN